MKVVVTGGEGQLGHALKQALQAIEVDHYVLAKEDLDVTNLEQVRKLLKHINPDVIIHSAAYTQVDLAESNPVLAYKVNAFGTRNVAVVANEISSKLCYFSTDYVFDGTAKRPYHEYDQANPMSIYGKTKLAGEELCKTLCSRYFIVRTSWLFGAKGNNFVKKMLTLANDHEILRVVHDQIGSPTYTKDLAEFVMQLIHTEKYGIYHATNVGSCSWCEFAQVIFEEEQRPTVVLPISTEEFSSPAPRPQYSVLDHLSIKANGFDEFRHWRLALQDYLKELRLKE